MKLRIPQTKGGNPKGSRASRRVPRAHTGEGVKTTAAPSTRIGERCKDVLVDPTELPRTKPYQGRGSKNVRRAPTYLRKREALHRALGLKRKESRKKEKRTVQHTPPSEGGYQARSSRREAKNLFRQSDSKKKTKEPPTKKINKENRRAFRESVIWSSLSPQGNGG